MFTREEAAALAEVGAEFYDGRCPGWFEDVDPLIIDMNHSLHCVLGQRYVDFCDGLRVLHITAEEAEKYGFILPYAPNENELALRARYKILSEAWKSEVAKRRAT